MFRAQALLRTVPGSDQFRLEEPLIWDDGAEFIAIPAGFRTDLASVPRAAQPLVPKTGPYNDAAVLHDYLFVVQDRELAAVNRLFLRAMECCGVRFTQRWLIWAAVSVGGWPAWWRNAWALREDRRGFLQSHGLEVRHAGV
jgi:hypothetical protein